MRSEPTDHWNTASDLRAYDQEQVAQYNGLVEAMAACEEANRQGGARHYVIDESGMEYYAGSWID